jgi:hypothetical protein
MPAMLLARAGYGMKPGMFRTLACALCDSPKTFLRRRMSSGCDAMRMTPLPEALESWISIFNTK